MLWYVSSSQYSEIQKRSRVVCKRGNIQFPGFQRTKIPLLTGKISGLTKQRIVVLAWERLVRFDIWLWAIECSRYKEQYTKRCITGKTWCIYVDLWKLYLLNFENWEREHREIILQILYTTRPHKPWGRVDFYIICDGGAVNSFPTTVWYDHYCILGIYIWYQWVCNIWTGN